MLRIRLTLIALLGVFLLVVTSGPAVAGPAPGRVTFGTVEPGDCLISPETAAALAGVTADLRPLPASGTLA